MMNSIVAMGDGENGLGSGLGVLRVLNMVNKKETLIPSVAGAQLCERGVGRGPLGGLVCSKSRPVRPLWAASGAYMRGECRPLIYN